MTVREAFEKAFGPLPEGATSCHVGTSWYGGDSPYMMGPTCSICSSEWPYAYQRGEWSNKHCYEFPNGPDISGRPASAFLGFFGEEYDRVVREAPGTYYAGISEDLINEIGRLAAEEFEGSPPNRKFEMIRWFGSNGSRCELGITVRALPPGEDDCDFISFHGEVAPKDT